ncbi:putative transposase [Haloferax larsenii JCM 13917]|nr:putative transposase [Haloferax larsenii JCM 13917]
MLADLLSECFGTDLEETWERERPAMAQVAARVCGLERCKPSNVCEAQRVSFASLRIRDSADSPENAGFRDTKNWRRSARVFAVQHRLHVQIFDRHKDGLPGVVRRESVQEVSALLAAVGDDSLRHRCFS